MNTTWEQQFVTVVVTLIIGVLALITALTQRKTEKDREEAEDDEESDEDEGGVRAHRRSRDNASPFNGYTRLILNVLDRADQLRTHNDALARENAELRGRLEECERHRRQLTPPRTPRRRGALPAPNPADRPAAPSRPRTTRRSHQP